MTEIVPQQLTLSQSIPTVVGCIDFTEFCKQIERFDKIIDTTELDQIFIINFIENLEKEARKSANKRGDVFRGFSYKQKIRIQTKAMISFRGGISRSLTGEGL